MYAIIGLSFLLCALIEVSYVLPFLIVHTTERNVTKVLTVTDGGRFGNWKPIDFCAHGTYAVGYNMKIESPGGDDTSLNGIRLECAFRDGRFGGNIQSGIGAWGEWVEHDAIRCSHPNEFLTSFRLQVEKYQGRGDDTMANYVNVYCGDFNRTSSSYALAISPGHGQWGDWTSISDNCDSGTAICGIATKIESPQGHGDDTSLNDVRMYCCT